MRLEEIQLWVQSVANSIDRRCDKEKRRRQRETTLHSPPSAQPLDAEAIATPPRSLKRKRIHQHQHRPDHSPMTPPSSSGVGPSAIVPHPVHHPEDVIPLPPPKRSRYTLEDGDKSKGVSSAEEAAYDDARSGEAALMEEATPRASRTSRPREGLQGEAVLAVASPTPHRARSSRRVVPLESVAFSASTRSSTTSLSRGSNASSPRKRLRALELAREPIRHRTLTRMAQDIPQDLADVCAHLHMISRGIGVLGQGAQDALTAHSHPAIREIAQQDYCFSAERDAIGFTPSPEQILNVVHATEECSDNSHSEISWNFEVHAPILAIALRPAGSTRTPQPCGFFACHTSRIIKEYLHASVPDEMVDFCIYLDPTGMKDDDAAARIEEVRSHLPELMINHTLNDSLRHRPIALSIETKKPGEGDDNAALQIGVWHSAQWNLLRSVANDKRGGEGEGEGGAEGDAAAGIGDGGGGRDLSFLPAIIIQGHEWNFAATTRRNGTTTLWSKQFIGSTTEPLGVCQIVAALHYLTRWAQGEYWQWFRQAVLGLPAET